MGTTKLLNNLEIYKGRGHIAKISPKVYPEITENHRDTSVLCQSNRFNNNVRSGKFFSSTN